MIGEWSLHPLLRMAAMRMGIAALQVAAMSVVIFAGTHMLPGDLAQAVLGQAATPEAVNNLRRELALDRPAHVRYTDWASRALHGDWGRSLTSGQEVGHMISERFGNSLILALCSALVAVPLAILLGLLSVHRRDGWVDRAISVSTLSAVSLPEFFIGYLLILTFSVAWPLLPANSIVFDGITFGDRIAAIALPATTLVLVSLAQIVRMTRAAVLGVMASPYIEMAELKGISPLRVIVRHALPNAASPIITVVMLNLASLVVGVVVVEVIFVYPGMGQLLVDHVAKRDVPVVQAAGLIFSAAYILLNLCAELLSILANPRLRHAR